MTDFERWRTLLGKEVRVTYHYGDDVDPDPIIAEGTLLGFGDGGDFEILERDGFVHYGWPMLHVEELTECSDS